MNPWDVIGWLILSGIAGMVAMFLLSLTVAAVSTIKIRLARKRRQTRRPEESIRKWWVERTSGGYGVLKTDQPIRKNIIRRPKHTDTEENN